MRQYCLIAAVIFLIGGCEAKKKPAKQGFATINELLKTVYPRLPKIDTVSLTTNQTAFVYNGDSIVINRLFVPLFPEYEADDSGKNIAIVDTPNVVYRGKRWTLPLSLQKARMQLDAVLCLPASQNGFMVFVLSDPHAMGTFSAKCTLVVLDTAEAKGITILQTDWLPDAPYITDYNNDGVIELVDYKNKGFHGNGQYLNEHYTASLRRLHDLQEVEGTSPVNFYDSSQNNQTLFYLK